MDFKIKHKLHITSRSAPPKKKFWVLLLRQVRKVERKQGERRINKGRCEERLYEWNE
jgi:hypothetical protein